MNDVKLKSYFKWIERDAQSLSKHASLLRAAKGKSRLTLLDSICMEAENITYHANVALGLVTKEEKL